MVSHKLPNSIELFQHSAGATQESLSYQEYILRAIAAAICSLVNHPTQSKTTNKNLQISNQFCKEPPWTGLSKDFIEPRNTQIRVKNHSGKVLSLPGKEEVALYWLFATVSHFV